MSRARGAVWAALVVVALGAERAGVRADLPVRSARTVTYTIEARLDPARKTVQGRMDLVWRNTSAGPVDHLFFHLYLNAFLDRDSSYLREGKEQGKAGAEWDERFAGRIDVESMQREDGVELWRAPAMRFVAPDDGNEKDRTLARVDLPAPVAPGETLALAVRWTSHLPRVLHRTGWSGDPGDSGRLFFMVAQWFPKIAVLGTDERGRPVWRPHQFHRTTEFFSDYGVYRVSLTVPAGYVVGATGRRLSATDNGDGTRTVVHRQEDVHDFAWTASPLLRSTEFEWSFDSFAEEEPAGLGKRLRALLERTARHLGRPPEEVKPARAVHVRLLYPEDHAGVLDRFRRAVGAALACYGIWFGEYPYDVLTIVDPPAGGRAAGGMEYPTLITVFGDRHAPPYATGMEGVTIHEFGHQFFYGLLGNNEFEEAWLDEGFTSYTDARVFEEAYGPRIRTTRYGPFHTPFARPFEPPSVYARISGALRLQDWLGKLPHPWKRPDSFAPVPRENAFWAYLRDMPALHRPGRVPVVAPGGERAWWLSSGTHDALVMPGWHFASRGDYAVNSYGKSTVFLYCLRGLMGEEAFDRALRDYAERFRFRHPTTADALAALQLAAPVGQRELFDGFVDAMVRSAARVDVALLEVSQREAERAGQWIWTVRVQRRGTVPLPVEVNAEDETGEVTRLATWVSRGGETTRTFRAVRDRKLRAVRLGPGWLRCVDSDLSNNARVAGPGDSRPAFVLSARWSLFVEEIVRTYAGLGR